MTRYERYQAELQRLKDASENHITGAVVNIQEVLYDALLEWMDNTLEYKSGELVASKDTIDLLNDFSNGFQKTIARLNPYQAAVSGFVKSLTPIGKEMTSFQTGQNEIDPKKAGVSDAQSLVVDHIIDAYTENGLNANIIQPLRDILYQKISAGTRTQDAKQSLKDYVKGGQDKTGKVERYLTLTAQQAVDSYTGAINKQLMDTFPYKHMIMSGSLIKNSSPQCRFVINKLGGVITREEWEKVIKPLAEENGLIAGTTFENLPLNKFHWGCRHEFTPMFLQKGDVIGNGQIFDGEKIISSAA